MPLHTDYRPSKLNDFFGNDSEIEKLDSMLDRPIEKIVHSFMFKGPKGCGKTTLARIVAKDLGCHDTDITELDIATNRGIDAAKELRSSVSFAPLSGSVKCYILDEVHMGTKEFFNGLLKTLEEPPNHVYFMLCTTEPEKVLVTVKSRCAVYTVDKLDREQMVEFLSWILEKEDVTLSKEVLTKISKASEGTPREALIMLDQVINLDQTKINEYLETAQTQEKQVNELCQSLLKQQSWKIVSKIINSLKEEPETIRRAVIGYMAAVALNNSNPSLAVQIIDEFSTPFYDTGKAGLVKACFMSNPKV